APALIHEEANLINRSLRDLYASDFEEVLVEGDEGYRMAKEFMRMLIPSHARRVKAYRDPVPLFHRHQVGSQLDAMHCPTVHLKSGGYIVISPTEALVSIDVNSGRATRERNVEETATKTNLEAADEIARQLRLRDLSGLIVIDFIDMEHSRNIRTVERRTEDAMKGDRARIQIGRISHFGLLELSRQRLRPSLLEASSLVCVHCGGTGHVRSTESTSLHVLRAIEEEGIPGRSKEITVYVPTAVALYILNQKRAGLNQIEERYGFSVTVASDDSLIPPDFRLERIRTQTDGRDDDSDSKVDGDQPERGRRRRRGRKDEDNQAQPVAAQSGATAGDGSAQDEAKADSDSESPAHAAGDGGEDSAPKRRRRGRRGGRRRRGDDQLTVEASADETPTPETTEAPEAINVTVESEAPADAADAAPEASDAPKPRRRRRKKANTEPGEETASADTETSGETEKPKRARRSRRKPAETQSEAAVVTEAPSGGGNGAEPAMDTSTSQPAPIEVVVPANETPVSEPQVPAAATIEADSTPAQPARRGWWKRLTD
ncbi:MAG: ribonuclease E/G, partial [Alphaproteobacteria bacterium]